MGLQLAVAVVLADLADGRIALTDIGTAAAIGGVLSEVFVRLAAALGIESEVDGWREGMFLGALFALLFWVFGVLGA